MTTFSSVGELPRASHRISEWVLIGLMGYAFLYDNSTSLPLAAGYGWTRLLDVPRQVRFIEIGVVVVVLLLLLARPVSSLTRNLLLAILAFSCLGVLSYLATQLAPVGDVLRLIYAYQLPALMFIIGREIRVDVSARDKLFRFILIWVMISAVISWYQFAGLGYPIGDNITSLNKDAHANGNLLVMASLILIARGLWLRRRNEIGLAFFLLLTLVLPSVIKTLYFGVLALVYVAYSYAAASKSPRRERKAGRIIRVFVLLALLFGSVSVAFGRLDLLSSERTGDVFNRIFGDLANFGPISAHGYAVNLVMSDPKALLIGYGPYSYANPTSVGQLLEGGSLSRFAEDILLARAGEHGEDTRITLTSSWLVELGPVATTMLLFIYGTILIQVRRCVRSADPLTQAYAVALVGALIVLYLTAATTLFGSLDVISVSWPVMLLAGMTVRLGEVNPMVGRTDAPIASA